jgi:hypothetical protein
MSKIHVDRFFGPFYFGQDIASLQSDGMRQVTEQELDAMRLAGMQFNPEEKVFTGNPVYYLTPEWRPIVVVRDGRVFNITLQRISREKRKIQLTHEHVIDWLQRNLDKPTEQTGNKYIWDLPNIRILVNMRSSFLGLGGHAVNLVATCFDLSKLKPITELELD